MTESSSTLLEKERNAEDETIQSERATADDAIRQSRVERSEVVSVERARTDTHLLEERSSSDKLHASRDEFMAIISHDLRSILDAVMGSAALLVKSVSHDRESCVEEAEKHAARVQRGGARISRLIGDLIDVASIEAGALAIACEIGYPIVVAEEAIESFQAPASAKGIVLVAEIEPSSRSIVASFDPARILQVLDNLLSNAIKFTPAQGKVTLGVKHVNHELRFMVMDTGVGIPADHLDRVFDRFRQVMANDRRGVGLGLFISRSIVQAHGGRMWAESTVGEGSVFAFSLPDRLQ
jgi:signal transduction histidine kinase